MLEESLPIGLDILVGKLFYSIMSGEKSELEQRHLSDAADEVCACCGVAEIDDVKLKLCDGGCDLVKYCSDNCQGNHRGNHVETCEKRKAELHDKDLFTQPDISHLGECPICCLPLPLHPGKSTLMTCCCKYICNGCHFANQKREKEAGLQRRCVYCREHAPKSKEEVDKRIMERIKKNDPVAMTAMGKQYLGGGDYGKSFENYTMAAELGDVEAHFLLGAMYFEGLGVEKDEKKWVYHCEQASNGGHPAARAVVAAHEMKNGRFERAAKHYIIAANLGHDNSLQEVKALFVKGIVSKEEYAAALRAHQAAVDATKSAEREEAEAFYALLDQS
jgi:hypothetical protein